ncbi:TPA: hypothetical protein OE941_001766 [Clostridioides difficile]|uniref:hypothetical protein n=1 Tax=Clostridioides difficile TaxID=1496 RepID=UPI00038D4A96|nr:hypothetical protein [Clostridioides difficile]EQI78446.1 hypothetical protein QQI_2956 [Clostridioides difficile Y401]HCP7139067.1 hypothetical protein [Clostridioides difficile]
MRLVSDEVVKEVILNLQKGDLESLNKMKVTGDKPRYHYIVRSIKNIDPEVREYICSNGERYLDQDESLDENIARIVTHILLEIPRADEFDRFKQQAENSQGQLRILKNQMMAERNQIENHEKKIEKVQSEFIAILTIFSAIIIAFFGGTQILGEVLSSIKNSNFYVLIMITIVIGCILFNVIYMLLYTVSKIIEKNIGININKKKCVECEKNSSLSCLITKYPVPFFYNLFSMISFAVIFIFYNFEKYGLDMYAFNSLIWMIETKHFVNIVGIVFGLVVVLVLISFGLKWLYNNKICTHVKKVQKKESNESEDESEPSPSVG